MRKLLFIILFILVSNYAQAKNYCEDASCQGCWLFSEGSGTTVADSSSNSNTGTFRGSGEPAWSSTVPASYVDNSVLFDGSNDDINVGTNASLDFTSGFTFVGWVYSHDAGAVERCIFGKRVDNAASYAVDIRNDGKVEFYFNDSGWYETKTTNVVISANTWYHIAITYDSTTKPLIYIDGSPVATNDIGSYPDLPVFTTQDTYISSYNGTDDLAIFDGLIAEVAVFNSALNSTDINNIIDYGLVPETQTNVPQVF